MALSRGVVGAATLGLGLLMASGCSSSSEIPTPKEETCGSSPSTAGKFKTNHLYAFTDDCFSTSEGFYFLFDVEPGRWVVRVDDFELDPSLSVDVDGQESRRVSGYVNPLQISFEVDDQTLVLVYVAWPEGATPYTLSVSSGDACDELCTSDPESYCGPDDECHIAPSCASDAECDALDATEPLFCTPLTPRQVPYCRAVTSVVCEPDEEFANAPEIVPGGAPVSIEQCSLEEELDFLRLEVDSPSGEPVSFSITTTPDDPKGLSIYPHLVSADRTIVETPRDLGGVGEAVHEVKHLPPGEYFIGFHYGDSFDGGWEPDYTDVSYSVSISAPTFEKCSDDSECGAPRLPRWNLHER